MLDRSNPKQHGKPDNDLLTLAWLVHFVFGPFLQEIGEPGVYAKGYDSDGP